MDQSRDEQIRLLSEQLLKLLASDDIKMAPEATKLKAREYNSADSHHKSKEINYGMESSSGYPKSIEETIRDFERRGLSISHIREIMIHTDKLKGRTDLFATKQSLFEQIEGLLSRK